MKNLELKVPPVAVFWWLGAHPSLFHSLSNINHYTTVAKPSHGALFLQLRFLGDCRFVGVRRLKRR